MFAMFTKTTNKIIKFHVVKSKNLSYLINNKLLNKSVGCSSICPTSYYHAMSRQNKELFYYDHSLNRTSKKNLSFDFLDKLLITQTSAFQSINNSAVVESVMSSLQIVHDTTNLPWWATIVLSTVFFRSIITFPLAIYQGYIIARFEVAIQELSKLVPELKKETNYAVQLYKWDKKHATFMYNKSLRKLRNEKIIEYNCHPFKASLLIWFQIPLWITLSMSWRNFASMLPRQDSVASLIFLEMSLGGVGWIPNLTIPDASLILPVAMALFNLINIEVTTLSKTGEKTRAQTILTNLFRGFSLMFIPIGMYLPSGVVLYWTTSSLFGLVQNLVLMNPNLRRRCGIPPTPSQRPNPYDHLYKEFGKKFLFKKE